MFLFLVKKPLLGTMLFSHLLLDLVVKYSLSGYSLGPGILI